MDGSIILLTLVEENFLYILSATMAVALLILFRDPIRNVIQNRAMKVSIGDFEIGIDALTAQNGNNIVDLQARLARLESNLEELKIQLGNGSVAAAALAPIENSQSAPTSSAARTADQDSTAPIRVLWVDDYPSNNAFLVERFRRNGITIDIALSTQQAIFQLDKENYNYIISDLGRRENGVDNPFAGKELLTYVKAKDIKTPVLIFAGARGLGHREELIRAGAIDVASSGVDVVRFVEGFGAQL